MDRQLTDRWRVMTLTLSAAALGVLLAGVLRHIGAAEQTAPITPARTAWSRGDPAVAAIIRIECRPYGIPEEFALCVADRESRFDPQAVGDDGDAVGLYQFHFSTWQHFRTRMGLPTDDLRLDARSAARTACWAFANGFQQRWTVVRLGLCSPLAAP